MVGWFTLVTICLPALHTCGLGCNHASCTPVVRTLHLFDLHGLRGLHMAAAPDATALACAHAAAAPSECLACSYLRNAQSDGTHMPLDLAGFAVAPLDAPVPVAPATRDCFTPLSSRAPPAPISL